MGVVCRMRVAHITQFGHATKVNLQAIHTSDTSPDATPEVIEEIKQFFEATPNGQYEATIKNEAAAEQFQVGDEFYLSLEKIAKHG